MCVCVCVCVFVLLCAHAVLYLFEHILVHNPAHRHEITPIEAEAKAKAEGGNVIVVVWRLLKVTSHLLSQQPPLLLLLLRRPRQRVSYGYMCYALGLSEGTS